MDKFVYTQGTWDNPLFMDQSQARMIVSNTRLGHKLNELRLNQDVNLKIANQLAIINNNKCIPLSTPTCFSQTDIDFKDENLYRVANVFAYDCDSKLDFIGGLYASCGMISCALWGQLEVNYPLNYDHMAPAIDYIIQFAPSGSRKSNMIEKLIKPMSIFANAYNDNLRATRYSEKENLKRSVLSLRKKLFIVDCAKRSLNGEMDVASCLAACDAFCDELPENEIRYFGPILPFATESTIAGLEKWMLAQGGTQAIATADGDSIAKLILSESDLLLKAFCHERYTRNTYTKCIDICRPSIPMVITLQPNRGIKLYRNERLLANGFLNRLMPYFHVRRNIGNILHCDYGWLDIFNERITKIFKFFYTQRQANPKIISVEYTKHTISKFESFKEEIAHYKDKYEFLSGWLAKLPDQALRFAADMHCWRHSDNPLEGSISEDELDMGITLAKVSISHAYFAFSPTGFIAYNDAQKILDNLRSITDFNIQNELLNIGTTLTGIKGRKIDISTERLKNALKVLSDHNYLVAIDTATDEWRIGFRQDFFKLIS